MKVLVTGASGFIGQNLVTRLLEQGHSVTALYRRKIVPDSLAANALTYPERLTLIQFDLGFEASMPQITREMKHTWIAQAKTGIPDHAFHWPIASADLTRANELMAGHDVCVHIAARVGDWGSFEDFFIGNVNPTHVLLEAAIASGLKRFVHVSSISVHGFGTNRDASEESPFFKADNPYQTSKRLAESLVADAGRRGLETVIVRPGNVYGPEDTTTFYPIFDAMHQGIWNTVARGRHLTCPIYIDDLLAAFCSAMTLDSARGETFNLTSGELVSWRELTDAASSALGLNRTWINYPAFVARPVGVVMEGLYKLIRHRNGPPVTRYRVDQVLSDYHFSNAKARRLLNWQALTDYRTGLIATAQAYQKRQRTI